MLFEVSKKRFVDEITRWCQSGDKVVNYSKQEGIYNFYLTTPDGDYSCSVIEEELTGADKMNLLGKGKQIIRRIKDDEILTEISESIQTNSLELNFVTQAIQNSNGEKKSEIMLKELLEKKRGK